LNALNGGGWGVFIAPTTILAIGCGFLSADTPDSPVPATPVARWSRPLDSPAPVVHLTVRWHTGQSGATGLFLTTDCFLTVLVPVAVDHWRR
jgi:hypothetical protein